MNKSLVCCLLMLIGLDATADSPRIKELEQKVEQLEMRLDNIERVLYPDSGKPNGYVVEEQQAAHTEQVLDVSGQAYGGVLRAKPDMNSARLGYVKEDESIHLIKRSDAFMNGYSWFKIRRANGDTGYLWGGLLCSSSRTDVGAYKTCD